MMFTFLSNTDVFMRVNIFLFFFLSCFVVTFIRGSFAPLRIHHGWNEKRKKKKTQTFAKHFCSDDIKIEKKKNLNRELISETKTPGDPIGIVTILMFCRMPSYKQYHPHWYVNHNHNVPNLSFDEITLKAASHNFFFFFIKNKNRKFEFHWTFNGIDIRHCMKLTILASQQTSAQAKHFIEMNFSFFFFCFCTILKHPSTFCMYNTVEPIVVS